MRRRLTDSTFPAFRRPVFRPLRDLYVTLGHARARFALSSVDESGDFRPCRKTQAGGGRRSSDRAADSRMRKRESACAAVPAVAYRLGPTRSTTAIGTRSAM